MVILTGDLDVLQLVYNERISVETPQRGSSETKIYNREAIIERFGVGPEQLIDYKGLVGDVSDNIPGVTGVGKKTAEKILKKFGTIENAFKNIEKDSLLKKLEGHEKDALFSKKLATIRVDVPLSKTLEDFVVEKKETKTLASYFEKLGFQSLVKRVHSETKNIREEKNKDTPLEERGVLVCTEKTTLSDFKKSGVLKIAFDWKGLLKKTNVEDPLFDIHIGAWLLDTESKINSLEDILYKYSEKPTKNERVDLKTAYIVLSKKLREMKLLNIFNTIEMPVVRILAEVEQNGVCIDKTKLTNLHKKISKEIDALAKKIFEEVGEVFNINSPQQLGRIIYDKLKIKSLTKRTSKGNIKTNKNVLEEIKNKHHIIPTILKYREYFKINSGFVVPLLELLDEDGKIHTSYLQTGTATGRISSEKPNLQNIPQESIWSEDIRNVFRSSPKKTLVSFDYSQIELRLLAHLSNDPGLLDAFHKNKDIHTRTAARVFGVEEELVTKAMRRVGKTLNFGVIYGMGSRAFSKMSGVSKKEAEEIIKNYFKNFPLVKVWQNKILEGIKKNHYAENINGRKRWFKENSYVGEFERAGINMPIQSLGADIIKKAMIETRKNLKKEGLWETDVCLLLLIHDELLFEISDDILNKTIHIIKNVMESIMELSVPLIVEVKTGKHWDKMVSFFKNTNERFY